MRYIRLKFFNVYKALFKIDFGAFRNLEKEQEIQAHIFNLTANLMPF